MRARRGTVIGWLVVGSFAAALVLAVITTHDTALRPGDRPDDGAAAEGFIEAWERSRRATFVRTGTFERRSEVTGSSISSEDVLVQRPPQRLHRQLGGVSGRDDRQLLVCPSAPAGATPNECTLGEPTGPTYEEDVTSEVAALRTLVTGANPVYAVGAGSEAGCFDLVQLRVEPRAPFGREARFCFDGATGAPTNSRVAYEGGIVEVVVVTELRGEVDDEDLEP
jgi:hypothetical protein